MFTFANVVGDDAAQLVARGDHALYGAADGVLAKLMTACPWAGARVGADQRVELPYASACLLFAGGLASLGSPLAVAVLLLSAWRFYKPRMASEDKILEDQFGDAWRNYATKTPSRLLPFVV